MQNLGRGYRRGGGPYFVLEGDEYNAAFFDRGPKFLHYEPKHLFIGNIEFDHADLYPDLPSVDRGLPQSGASGARERRRRRQRRRSARRRGRRGFAGARHPRLAPGPRRRLLGPRHRVRARGDAVHAPGSGPSDDPAVVVAGRDSTTCATPSARSPSCAGSASPTPRSPGRCPALAASSGVSRSRARRTASSSWTTSRTIPPRSPGRSRPRARSFPAAGSGPSSSRGRTPPAGRCSRTSTPRPSPPPMPSSSPPSSTPSASAPTTRSTAPLSSGASRRAAGRPSRPTRSRRSPRSSAAKRVPDDVLLLMSSGAFGGLPETLLDEL